MRLAPASWIVLAGSLLLAGCGATAPTPVAGGTPAKPFKLLAGQVGTEREFNNYYSGEIDTWLLRGVGYDDLLQGKWGRAAFRIEETFYDEVGGSVGGKRVRLRVGNDYTLSGEAGGKAVSGTYDGRFGSRAEAGDRTVYLERRNVRIEGRTPTGPFVVTTTMQAHEIQLLGLLAVLLAGDPSQYGP
ncbi:MAG: hypothetical protein FJZ00_02060 [Candidatus Sericytochromatia bacterium]|uniref:Lipoprotein n=1 Tax=Candidatus Tanganyikabacteria bacterium TaxID=2961651 RepID=A0A937X0V9_9BACT|nr:hypothetical protein [Candidatus Tanganyikabacteria bacterium]